MARATQRSDGEQTQARILDTTLTMVADEGTSAVSHRRVAQIVGITPAAIAYHFPTLSDLLTQTYRLAVRRYAEHLAGLRDRALAGEISLVDACLSAVRTEDGSPVASAVVCLDLLTNAMRNPALRPEVDDVVRMLQDFFEPWAPRPELATGAIAAFLSLSLLDMASGGEHPMQGQIATLLEAFHIDEAVHVQGCA